MPSYSFALSESYEREDVYNSISRSIFEWGFSRRGLEAKVSRSTIVL